MVFLPNQAKCSIKQISKQFWETHRLSAAVWGQPARSLLHLLGLLGRANLKVRRDQHVWQEEAKLLVRTINQQKTFKAPERLR